MSVKSVLDIIKELEITPSSNDKLAILKREVGNEKLKEVFRLTYSTTINFGVKNVPDYTVNSIYNVQMNTFEYMFDLLNKLRTRELSGNNAQSAISFYLSQVESDTSELFIRILKKDLRCNTGKSLANKVWKGLIPVTPRMGACSMNEKSLERMKKFKNLAVELKSDGTYAASVCGETSTMMTRNGNELIIPSLQEHLCCGEFDGFALEGELIYDPTKATREEGNGHITRIVKGTASSEHLDNVYYQVWDCIDTSYYEPKGEYPLTNKERRELLESMVESYNGWCVENRITSRILLIPRQENVTVDEAFEVFEGYVKDGMEGAICKNMESPWKDVGKPSWCIKLKRKDPADLKVVGWYKGEVGTKYESFLGGLHCESSCGTIKVNVGSGFSDEDRFNLPDNLPEIVEVEYDSITEDKKTKQKSLFLPIYKRPRYDKVEPDSYEDILDKVRIK
jgi:ATP-dependent DNA ligase|tara:strand:- start:4155 stop:5510 length:1356 start_codon:yes stop_codon:yes gene_type:complete